MTSQQSNKSNGPTLAVQLSTVHVEDGTTQGPAVLPENRVDIFLNAVRSNDHQLIRDTANYILSDHATFTRAVPKLTLAILDGDPAVRGNAAYLLGDAIHWVHREDLNSWVLPTLTKALDTLEMNGPVIWLANSLAYAANQISQENIDSYAIKIVSAFDQTGDSSIGLCLLMPFCDRLSPIELRGKSFTALQQILLTRASELQSSPTAAHLNKQDSMRMALPVVAISLLNLERHCARGETAPHQTQRRLLQSALEAILVEYTQAVLSIAQRDPTALSIEDRSVLFAVAVVFGNRSLEFSRNFLEMERCLIDAKDSFAASLCRLTSGRKSADPYSILVQAQNELQGSCDLFSIFSTLENACIALHRGPQLSEKKMHECAEILRGIQRITSSRLLSFYVVRALEAFDSNSE